jgi:hypothetical protein
LHKIDGNVEKQTVILEKMNSSLVDIAYSQKDCIIVETKPFRDDIHSQKDWKLWKK